MELFPLQFLIAKLKLTIPEVQGMYNLCKTQFLELPGCQTGLNVLSHYTNPSCTLSQVTHSQTQEYDCTSQ